MVLWGSLTLAAATLLVFIIVPFLRGPRSWMPPDEDAANRDLIAEKEALLRAIKDIEFEYHNGTLSGEDRDVLREEYKRRAIEVMKKIGSDRRSAGDDLRLAVESEVAAERQLLEAP